MFDCCVKPFSFILLPYAYHMFSMCKEKYQAMLSGHSLRFSGKYRLTFRYNSIMFRYDSIRTYV